MKSKFLLFVMIYRFKNYVPKYSLRKSKKATQGGAGEAEETGPYPKV